jgi:SM-20-related protein
MSNADFFSRLGLLVIKDFIDPETCEDLRAQMSAAEQQRAWTYDYDSGISKVDENSRKTREALVRQSTRTMMQERLLEIKQIVEKHFNTALTGCREPNFLVYRVGDFFRLHRDSAELPSNLDSLTEEELADWERRVSVVLFLNKQTKEPEAGTYGGGALCFYGLVEGKGWENYGFPLVGEPGLLIAFSPEIYHQVNSITHGERYTIVSWFV